MIILNIHSNANTFLVFDIFLYLKNKDAERNILICNMYID